MRFLFLGMSLLFLIPNFFNLPIEKKPVYNKVELFDTSLMFLQSVDKLVSFADSTAHTLSIRQFTPEYGIHVANIIKKRFYHGFSSFNFRENWIAATLHLAVGKSLAYPVYPEDILQHPFAGCSQQVIVLMAAMKKKEIPFRRIGFPHHYAVELFFDRKWYFFDPDMEPKMKALERVENRWNRSVDSLKKFYAINSGLLNWGFGTGRTVDVGLTNAEPAPNALIFQKGAKLLSKTLWMFPFLFAVAPRRKKKVLRR
ncbi:MAG: hypothetical protein ABIR19_01260 [Ginsengibacter sp.]